MSEIDTRSRVQNFYLTHSDKPKSFTAVLFILEGVPKSTVYSIIKRAENGKRIERSHGSGRKPKIMDKKGINALSKAFDHCYSISQRQKFKCPQQCISKTLKKKTTIIYKKKTKIPALSETQKANEFEEHILVYVAISPRGISKPYILPNELAINQEVYTSQ